MGKVNYLRLKSSVASKWASKLLRGTIYFAVDVTYIVNVKNLIEEDTFEDEIIMHRQDKLQF